MAWTRSVALAWGLCGLLAACSDPSPPPDPALIADDSLMQAFDRHLRPRIYWSTKVAELRQREETSHTAFRQSFQAYQEMLRQRRVLMSRLMESYRKEGKDPLEGRRQAILQFRDQLAKLRLDNREAGKRLRQEIHLLSQAEQALAKSR